MLFPKLIFNLQDNYDSIHFAHFDKNIADKIKVDSNAATSIYE